MIDQQDWWYIMGFKETLYIYYGGVPIWVKWAKVKFYGDKR